MTDFMEIIKFFNFKLPTRIQFSVGKLMIYIPSRRHCITQILASVDVSFITPWPIEAGAQPFAKVLPVFAAIRIKHYFVNSCHHYHQKWCQENCLRHFFNQFLFGVSIVGDCYWNAFFLYAPTLQRSDRAPNEVPALDWPPCFSYRKSSATDSWSF